MIIRGGAVLNVTVSQGVFRIFSMHGGWGVSNFYSEKQSFSFFFTFFFVTLEPN